MAGNQTIMLNIGQGLSLIIGMPTISTWKSKARPRKAKSGTFGFNSQTNKLEYYDGKDWYEANMDKA
jgi:hypothetical protein